MNPLTASLKPGSTKSPPAVAAFFLPGADPSRWIDTLLTLSSPESARLFPVPSALGKTDPAGLLAVPASPESTNTPTNTIPLARLGDSQVYYPAASHFDPPLASADVAGTLTNTHTYFFHPSAGLIGFPESSSLALHDLVGLRIGDATDWSHARAGETPNTTLHQIRVTFDEPDPIDQLLEASEGIGDKELKGLPQPERRPGGNPLPGIAASVGKGGVAGVAHLVKWITGLAPTDPTKSKRTLIDKLSDWAGQKTADLSKRNRELNRLLELLKENPDEGLRYALPMGGGQRDRGLAAPGDTLGKRNLDFDLGDLGGGQRVDHWDISWEIQAQLIASYREAAARESRLGRHRRAAYIYAQLLDDLHAAAAALRSGRHFREAAHLYRDQLDNPKLAAQCFREAGLFEEAITLYRDLGEHVILGDLLREIDREPEAVAAYRIAIDDHLSKDHPLEASELVSKKLHDPSGTLSILRRAWPDSQQASQCLQRELEITSPPDPEGSRRRLLSFRDEATPPHLLPKLTRILADLSIKAQDHGLRTFAADETRRVAGLALTDPQVSGRSNLLSAVAATARKDRLLPRDTLRYQKANTELPKPVSPFRGALEDATVELGTVTRITKVTTILAAQPTYSGVLLWTDYQANQHLTYTGWPLNVPDDLVSFHIRNPISGIPDIIPSNSGTIFAVLATGTEFVQQQIGSDDGRLFIGPPKIDTADGILALCYNEHAHANTLRHHNGEFLINTYDWKGTTVSSTTLDTVPDFFGQMFAGGLDHLFPIVARRKQIILALGDRLIRVFRNRIESKPLPSPALSITASPHLSALRLVVALENGDSLLIRGDSNWDEPPAYLPETEATPQVCFERGGNLLIAHARHLIIYDPKKNRTARQHRDLFPEPPLALAASNKVGEFYAITSQGIHKANLRD